MRKLQLITSERNLYPFSENISIPEIISIVQYYLIDSESLCETTSTRFL